MAGGYERAYGSRIELEAAGGFIADGSFVQAADNNILTTDDEGYPYLMFYGLFDWGTTPYSNFPVYLYAQPRSVISTNHGEVPQTDCQAIYLGVMRQDASTADLYATDYKTIVHRPHFEAAIYVHNAMNAPDINDFQLYCYPWTYRRIQ